MTVTTVNFILLQTDSTRQKIHLHPIYSHKISCKRREAAHADTQKKTLCFLHKRFCTSNINRDIGRLFCKSWKGSHTPSHGCAMHFVHEQLSLQLELCCPAPLSDLTLAKPKSQSKSWGVAAMHRFERLQKVTGARQTAQDSSEGSQACSSPRAQRG